MYYQTRLCGASNAKANRDLHFALSEPGVANCVESSHLATRNMTIAFHRNSAKL